MQLENNPYVCIFCYIMQRPLGVTEWKKQENQIVIQ